MRVPVSRTIVCNSASVSDLTNLSLLVTLQQYVYSPKGAVCRKVNVHASLLRYIY